MDQKTQINIDEKMEETLQLFYSLKGYTRKIEEEMISTDFLNIILNQEYSKKIFSLSCKLFKLDEKTIIDPKKYLSKNFVMNRINARIHIAFHTSHNVRLPDIISAHLFKTKDKYEILLKFRCLILNGDSEYQSLRYKDDIKKIDERLTVFKSIHNNEEHYLKGRKDILHFDFIVKYNDFIFLSNDNSTNVKSKKNDVKEEKKSIIKKIKKFFGTVRITTYRLTNSGYKKTDKDLNFPVAHLFKDLFGAYKFQIGYYQNIYMNQMQKYIPFLSFHSNDTQQTFDFNIIVKKSNKNDDSYQINITSEKILFTTSFTIEMTIIDSILYFTKYKIISNVQEFYFLIISLINEFLISLRYVDYLRLYPNIYFILFVHLVKNFRDQHSNYKKIFKEKIESLNDTISTIFTMKLAIYKYVIKNKKKSFELLLNHILKYEIDQIDEILKELDNSSKIKEILINLSNKTNDKVNMKNNIEKIIKSYIDELHKSEDQSSKPIKTSYKLLACQIILFIIEYITADQHDEKNCDDLKDYISSLHSTIGKESIITNLLVSRYVNNQSSNTYDSRNDSEIDVNSLLNDLEEIFGETINVKFFQNIIQSSDNEKTYISELYYKLHYSQNYLLKLLDKLHQVNNIFEEDYIQYLINCKVYSYIPDRVIHSKILTLINNKIDDLISSAVNTYNFVFPDKTVAKIDVNDFKMIKTYFKFKNINETNGEDSFDSIEFNNFVKNVLFADNGDNAESSTNQNLKINEID